MKKTMMILLSVVLVAAISVAGTLAYLTDETDPVENTFIAGELTKSEFTLQEHKAIPQTDGSYELSPTELVTANEYKVIPGVNIPKDPFVSVNPEIDAYLFVEIVGNQGGTGWGWGYQEGWEAFEVSTVKGPHGGSMFWREVKPTGKTQEFGILSGDTIMVGDDVKPENAADMNLNFYAYLCQKASFNSASDAWNAIKGEFTPKT